MNVVEQALYARLTGSSTLTNRLASSLSVYNQLAPQGAALPYVVFALMGGGDDNKSPHRAKQLVYLVKALSSQGFKQAGEIDAVIDSLLHNQPLSVTGWENYWLMREEDVRYVETAPGGGQIYHAGGRYRLRIAQ